MKDTYMLHRVLNGVNLERIGGAEGLGRCQATQQYE